MSAGHGQVGIVGSPCAQRKSDRRMSVRSWPNLWSSVLLALSSWLCGCARFPAIDPNGQSIFLPYPASTEITVPQIHAGNGNPGIIPQDAYPTPLPPPACVDGSCSQPGGIQNLFQHHQKKKQAIANHFAKKDPGRCGQIQLSPTRIVAPVNGEVLLLAGICGKDGYLLKREPLEWMLAPGSVGQFIEVGDDAKGKLCSSFRSGPKVEKLDVDFARGRTSAKATLLTKGTPGCEDDLEVAEGQTWLSISSPNEGVSRVTVLAPDSELWDKRRETATIYWVDSQAQFPEPIRIDTTQRGTLTTRVTSAENMKPAEGWKVRYTIVDPNVAVFLGPGDQPITATNVYVAEVDPNGMATVALRARGPIGVTPVHIEVIRPMQAAENLPELILHQSDTFVTVSAPGLDVLINGPDIAAVGDTLEYVASLANPGDINAENATLRFVAPVGTTVVEAIPRPENIVNGAYLWNQGVLEAGRQVNFVIRLRFDRPETFALQFVGQAVGLEKSIAYQVRTVAPSVNVSMVRVPENTTGTAEVNEVVYYEVAVRNSGTQALVNLQVKIDTTPGWQEANERRTSVENVIPMLQPGQVQVLPLALRVIQEGQHTATVSVSSNGTALAQSAPVGLTGVPPRPRRPRVEAAIRTAPEVQARVGEATNGYFIVTNTGETPLENLDVTIKHDPRLVPKQVDTENGPRVRQIQGDNTTLHWTPDRLMPGQFVQLTVLFVPQAATSSAGLAMTVVNGETTATTSAALAIVGSDSVLPPTGGNGAPPNPASRTGAWQLLFEPLQNPTVVGNRVTIPVEIRNGQNLQDTNLRIQVALPEGIDLTGIERGGVAIPATQTERGVWTLPAEKFIRPNETVNFFLIVTPRVAQQATISIAVASDGQPTPQVQRRTFTVNPR